MRGTACLLLLCFLLCCGSAQCKVIYVNCTAIDDTRDGLSWANAKRSIESGLPLATAGDSIWVAEGDYVTRGFTLRSGTELYGGFAGSETSLDQRDSAEHPTVIRSTESRASGVQAPAGASDSTVIDGFTIRGFPAGISCAGASPRISNNLITANLSYGVCCTSSSSPTILANTISENLGIGIYCYQSGVSIAGNTITRNTGSGIYCEKCPAQTISGNRVIGNGPSSAGGGISCLYSSPTISGNLVMDNISSSFGGGIKCHLSNAVVSGNTIRGNSASGGGGLMIDNCSSAVVLGNLIAGNSAGAAASGVFNGGGVYCSASTTRIENNTFLANTACSGGGAIYLSSTTTATIANNIVYSGSSGILKNTTYTATMRNNCVYGNDDYNYSGMTDPTGTDGNISADPKVFSVTYGDGHMSPDSPCRNAGSSTVVFPPGAQDIDGQPRVQGTRVDIGADESYGELRPVDPTVIRVSTHGSDSNDGSSWQQAKRTLQSAVYAAAENGAQVWVEAGVYNERITLPPFVVVYGGFSGEDTSSNQRDWRKNLTVLDGQAGGSVVTIRAGFRFCTWLEGFTIRNGTGTRTHSGSTETTGGGIYIVAASPSILNNTITGNSSSFGAAIYCLNGIAAIYSNDIYGNSRHAIYCDGPTRPAIFRNTIRDNTGDGIYCRDADSAILDNAISGNSDNGVRCSGYSGSIARNRIESNGLSGIDMYGCDGWVSANLILNNSLRGVQLASAGTSSIYCNTIVGNGSQFGGAIYFYLGAAPRVVNNIIAFNVSGVDRDPTGGSPSISYNCIFGNTSFNYRNIADPTGASGNISADPRFLDQAGGDYHLRPSSPCIDAADGDLLPNDMSNNPRWDHPLIPNTGSGSKPYGDMGGFEHLLASVGIGGAKLLDDLWMVNLADCVVSAPFGGFFYVQTPDRTSGIRVQSPTAVAERSTVNVSGFLRTNADGERYIEAATCAISGAVEGVSPLGLKGAAIGGGDWFWDPRRLTGQPGVTGGRGLSNVGLLVRTTGVVTHDGTSWFYLDDGSGRMDGSGHVGVKVYGVAPRYHGKSEGNYVAVTGISSCERLGDGLISVIRTRWSADVARLQ